MRNDGGDVKIISSNNLAGEKLLQLSGIAALTRFPIYDLKEEDDSQDEDNDQLEVQMDIGEEEIQFLDAL